MIPSSASFTGRYGGSWARMARHGIGNFLNRGFVVLLTLELGAVDSVNRQIKFRDLLPMFHFLTL